MMNKFLRLTALVPFGALVLFCYNPMPSFAMESTNNSLLHLQQRKIKITGTISSETGEKLSGVSVKVLNKKMATKTNLNGNFTIEVEENDELVFSSIGFKKHQVKINQQTTLQITLETDASQLSEVTILGSRAVGRVNIESPVPVDVFDVQKLNKEVPQTNINQILNYVAPSFTSNTQTIADGTDHIDPAQLRGLGPDQVLVLVNGKRRHTTSLVNINGTPGRGSVGTDLNALPSFAISKLEVLRDGAAAQYGSDAIAGVVNLNMKTSTGKLTAMLNTGSNAYNGKMDGLNLQLDLNYGIKIKKKGFVNFTGSTQFRGATNRAGEENNTIFNAYNAIEYRALQNGSNINNLYSNINNTQNTTQIINTIKQYAPQVSYFNSGTQNAIAGANSIETLQGILKQDVTYNELAYRRMQRSDFNMRVGQSNLASGQLFANGELPLNEDWKLYAFGGVSYRNGLSAGFYRKPNQSRSYTGLYPNGFLPEIASNIYDYSFAAGIKGKFGKDFYVDLSNTWGKNQFKFGVENTVNTTLGMNSPTSFNAGNLDFSQNTSNLDISKPFAFWDSNLAFGAELRLENFVIGAGNPNSYTSYDINGLPVSPTTPDNLQATDFFGAVRPGGAQVFPGYRASNALSKNRNSIAGYPNYDLNPAKWILLDLAVRAENYSDFGGTLNYKIASRFKINKNINFRLAANTGFRAPSLHQIYFNATSTQFVGGLPFEVGTFNNSSQAAKMLGIPQLKQENSASISTGLSFKIPKANLTFSTDAYYIKIDNRVVLTDQFNRPTGTFATGTPQRNLQQLFDGVNATAATFFANAVDTKTMGLDIVISNKNKWEAISLNNDFALNVNRTERVGNIHASEILSDAGQINSYYSEATRIYFEEATPRIKFNLSHSLTLGKISFFLRNAYFGKVKDPNTADVNGDGLVSAHIVNGKAVENEHPVYGGKIITDFTMTYTFPNSMSFSIGVNNLLDIYPAKNLGPMYAKRPSGVSNGQIQYNNAPTLIDLSNNNQFVYSRNISQFGANGRYIFARVTYGF